MTVGTRRLAATLVLTAAGTALVAGCAATTGAAAGAATETSATSSPSPVPVVQLPAPASSTADSTTPPVSAPTQAPSTAPPVPSSPPSPTPTPCPIPEQRFVRVLSIAVDPATHHEELVAQPAKGLCGGGIPNDVEYVVTGPTIDYDVAVTVKITAVDHGGQPYSMSWAQFAASNLNEYGGFYGIDFNNGGLVTVIDQYFHP